MKLKKKKEKKKVSCLARVGDLRRTMFSPNIIFVLMYQEECLVSNYNNLALSSVFQYVLQEFKNMFQDEVPKGLPVIRGIEHKVDFILRTVIPNKSAYRVNPTEQKKLKSKWRSS